LYQKLIFRIPGLFQGFPGPMPFPGVSRPGNLNILIPGLSRVCTNPKSNMKSRNWGGFGG